MARRRTAAARRAAAAAAARGEGGVDEGGEGGGIRGFLTLIETRGREADWLSEALCEVHARGERERRALRPERGGGASACRGCGQASGPRRHTASAIVIHGFTRSASAPAPGLWDAHTQIKLAAQEILMTYELN